MKHDRTRTPFAKKSLGQNFLVDDGFILKIVASFNPGGADIVLEIGPGRGALTEELVDRAGKVYALEFDDNLAEMLRENFRDRSNFTVIKDDALTVDFSGLVTDGQKLRLIANLPYNISTAVLQRLFDFPDVFTDCVLMFQREVVDRITARPGTKDRGYLTVLTEAYFDSERLFDVPPTAFKPVPQVWSSVVRLVPHKRALANDANFRQLVGAAFVHKRKTILNNLKSRYADAERSLTSSGIEPNRRAETLSIDEWLRLASSL